MAEDVGGFDDRKLLKIRLRAGDKSVPAFDAIPGVEIVSQEDESIVLAFATDDGLSEFESRLATLARDGVVTRKELFYVIEDFDHWTPQDRTGAALLEQGFPAAPTFMLDVELWPQERQDKRQQMVRAFLDWLHAQGIERLDDIQQPSSWSVCAAPVRRPSRSCTIAMCALPTCRPAWVWPYNCFIPTSTNFLRSIPLLTMLRPLPCWIQA